MTVAEVDPDDRLMGGFKAFADGDLVASAAACSDVLRTDPSRPDAWLLKGVLARRTGEVQVAIAAYREALRLRPAFPEACLNLANALQLLGQTDEVDALLSRAVAVSPAWAQAWFALGNARLSQNRAMLAIEAFREATKLSPAYIDAWNNLGKACWITGSVELAVDAFRQTLTLAPENIQAHQNLLTLLHYDMRVDSAAILAEHRVWNERHAAALVGKLPEHDCQLGRRLRIGYVSWNFRRDAAGCFIGSILKGHNHDHFEVFAYFDNPAGDAYTDYFRSLVDVWVESHVLSDDAFFQRVKADRIDILVDLTGHTGRSRLLAFARRAAPVQISWLGYEGTTGLAAMDWLVGDRQVLPAGAENICSEQLIRLPYDFQCFMPPEDAPEVMPPPCLRRGFITFGSFNKPAKLNQSVLAAWADILHRVPTARLLLKSPAFEDPGLQQNFLARLSDFGVARERIFFRGGSPYLEMMAEYSDVDIALDTFPFSGGATSCDALWMGVPLVTLRGERFAANHTTSHLSAAGFPDWIASTLEEYLDIAAGLAANPAGLADLRHVQRDLVSNSPLCDQDSYMRHVELALRRIWNEWCVGARNPSLMDASA